MNRLALQYLYELGEICGEPCPTQRGERMCLLQINHNGACSPFFVKGELTREQRLARDVAKLKAQRDRRQRHRESLKRRLTEMEASRARDRAMLGYRIHYRIVGFKNRLRRYWRIAWHRSYGRLTRSWPRQLAPTERGLHVFTFPKVEGWKPATVSDAAALTTDLVIYGTAYATEEGVRVDPRSIVIRDGRAYSIRSGGA